MSVSIGQVAPDFALEDTEGRRWSVAKYDGAPATVVVFTCNHCPYALAWQDRIAQGLLGEAGINLDQISSAWLLPAQQ